MGFRITTWNVNGIRNPFSYEPWRGTRTFESMFDILESDIVVFQETKIQRKDLRDDMVLVPGWDCYFSLPKFKKGYSGVVIYTRNATCAPIRAEEGITGVLCPPNSSVAFRDLPEEQQVGGYPTLSQLTTSPSAWEQSDTEDQGEGALSKERIDAATLDSEGRCVVLEFPAFVLIGTYCPAYRDESRDSFRMDFLNALDARIRNLVSLGKRVFVTGDINISKAPIDSAHALENIRKSATTEQEFILSPPRRLFNALLADGVVIGDRDNDKEQPVLHDICRSFHPNRPGMYTCWDTRLNTRPGNYGSRIDYVLCSLDMREWFSDSNIQEGLLGSDHCPVYAVFKEQVLHNGNMVPILDIMNPLEWRLLPEFDVDKRRSIKDMFARKPPTMPSQSPPKANVVENLTTAIRVEHELPTPSQIDSNGPLVTPDGSSVSNPMPRKRPPQPPTVPAKRSKSAAASNAASTAGQKTLKGFFKPKAVGSSSSSQSPTYASPASTSNPDVWTSPSKGCAMNESTTARATQTTEPPLDTPAASTCNPLVSSPPSKPDHDDTVIDPIVSKEDWSKLFTKKPVPRCDSHEEPCISLTTKKPGINRGRAFWICPRPLGPHGEKEKGTQWRCPTFIWASDWNGSSQPES
ncbi:Endonuclease/exonuclease/phosphatase [Penicillium longicatenatum]|nr:Endonuclease/exonuclease/phosphatase [Penicillium longicatenatum]